MNIVWLLGIGGVLMVIGSAVKNAWNNGALKTLAKAATGKKPVKAIPDDPDDQTLLKLEIQYGIVSKNGKDPEKTAWRIARLHGIMQPEDAEEEE